MSTVLVDPESGQEVEVGEMTAEQRFDTIRNLWRAAERMRLKMCALLAIAERGEDWRVLGYDDMTGYMTDGLGLPQSSAAKMLAAGRVFCRNTATPMWEQLPQADQDAITIGSAYEAARMVTAGEWTPAEALHEAVVQTADKIADIRKGRESFNTHVCECPRCGTKHYASNV